MTNQHPNHNELLAEDGLAVSFEDDRNAYNALTVLKELDSQRRVGVQEAVLVVRGEDGRVVERTGSSRSSSPTPPPALGAISSTVQVERTSLLAVVTESRVMR